MGKKLTQQNQNLTLLAWISPFTRPFTNNLLKIRQLLEKSVNNSKFLSIFLDMAK